MLVQDGWRMATHSDSRRGMCASAPCLEEDFGGKVYCHIPVFSKFNSGPPDQLRFVIPPDYRTWAMYLLQSFFICSCKPVLNLSVPLAT